MHSTYRRYLPYLGIDCGAALGYSKDSVLTVLKTESVPRWRREFRVSGLLLQLHFNL